MSILLYLLYGEQPEYQLELTYSVLSAMDFIRRTKSDITIILACEERSRRPDLPVEHVVLSEKRIFEWSMSGTYRHAIKLNILKHVLEESNQKTILIDTDTFFLKHPNLMFDRVGPGTSLMHASEGRLGDSSIRVTWEVLEERSGGVVRGWPIDMNTIMHNSGVLGLDPSDSHLMTDALNVVVGIREQVKIFTAEQLAASVVLAKETVLRNADDVVEHYWGGSRSYYHYQIGRMYPSVLERRGITDVAAPLVALKSLPAPGATHRLRGRVRAMLRRAGPGYGYAYAAYLTSISLKERDAALANVWADRALSVLRFGIRRRISGDVHDFCMFSPLQIDRQDWMDARLRNQWVEYWKQAIN